MPRPRLNAESWGPRHSRESGNPEKQSLHLDWEKLRLGAIGGYSQAMLGAITIDVVKEYENGKCLISCPSLPVYTFGEDEREAEANLLEAVSVFLECCADDGTLPQVLLKHGFRVTEGGGEDPPSATKLDYRDGTLRVPFMFGDQSGQRAHP